MQAPTAAWFIVSSIGWDGVGGAVATTVVAMVLATSAVCAGGVVLGKALGLLGIDRPKRQTRNDPWRPRPFGSPGAGGTAAAASPESTADGGRLG